MEVRIVHGESSNSRYYLFRGKITDCHIAHFMPPKAEQWQLNDLEPGARVFVEQLLEIPGITDIYIKPRQITLCRHPMFAWKEIEPGLFEAMKKLFDDEVTPDYKV